MGEYKMREKYASWFFLESLSKRHNEWHDANAEIQHMTKYILYNTYQGM